MNLQQLIDDLKLATKLEFGDNPPTEMFPSKYFDHSVTTISPTGAISPRAPKYCATDIGVSNLVNALNESRNFKVKHIVLAEAMIYRGLESGWRDSRLVPWVQFSNRSVVNAGVLLDYCNHGYMVSKVLDDLINEVKNSPNKW